MVTGELSTKYVVSVTAAFVLYQSNPSDILIYNRRHFF